MSGIFCGLQENRVRDGKINFNVKLQWGGGVKGAPSTFLNFYSA